MMSLRATAVLALGFGLVFAAASLPAAPARAAGGMNGPQPTVNAAATPDGAIGSYLAARNQGFAGNCDAAQSPDDLGKICVRLQATQGDVQAYMAGATFSEYNLWLFVRRDSDGWRVIDATPLDPDMTSLTIPWPASAGAS